MFQRKISASVAMVTRGSIRLLNGQLLWRDATGYVRAECAAQADVSASPPRSVFPEFSHQLAGLFSLSTFCLCDRLGNETGFCRSCLTPQGTYSPGSFHPIKSPIKNYRKFINFFLATFNFKVTFLNCVVIISFLKMKNLKL